MAFDKDVANDADRVAQLKRLEEEVEYVYQTLPQLRRPKGKSGASSTPVMIDWSEPSAKDVVRVVMNRLLRERYNEENRVVDEGAYAEKYEPIAERAYFFRNTFISQGKHGTAIGVGVMLDFADDGHVIPKGPRISDPGKLAYHCLSNMMPALKVAHDSNSPGAFEDDFLAYGALDAQMRQEVEVVDETIKLLTD